MTESIVEKELKTCGKAFFVEYFSALNQIDWYDENQVEKIRKYISEDLIYKRRPDGGKYTEAGLAMRFSSFFIIFSQGLQWEALKNISESRGLPQEVRQSAKKMYVGHEEKSAINDAQNEQFAKLMQEFLHRKKEEEKAREEAKRKQEEKAREETKRKQEEKVALCNAREELMQEKEEQEKIIALNRGWFFGKKAKIRRAAKRRLQEIENELEKIENRLEEIENELEDFPTFQ